MLFLLVITLSILLFFNIRISNGDILAPAPLSVSMFLFMSVIALFYENYSKAHISVTTYIVIVISLILFCVGNFLGRTVIIHVGVDRKKLVNFKRINIQLFFNICAIVFCLTVFILSLRGTLRISNSIAGDAMILAKVRSAYVTDDASIGGALSLMGRVVVVIGYFYTLVLINNFILDGKKIKREHYKDYFCYIIIMVICFLNSILSTSRTFLIKWIVISIVVAYYVNNANSNKVLNIKSNTKFVFELIVVVAAFFGAFLVLGVLTGKTGIKSVAMTLYEYTGSSIPALSYFIDINTTRATFFGEESFYGMFVLLNHFGFSFPVNAGFQEMIKFDNGLTTNIFTSLRCYLHDFGYLGTYCVQFIIGLINGLLYCKLRNDKKYDFCYIYIYALLYYGLVMQAISETWLRTFMSISQLSDIIIFLALYFIFVKKGLKVKFKA